MLTGTSIRHLSQVSSGPALEDPRDDPTPTYIPSVCWLTRAQPFSLLNDTSVLGRKKDTDAEIRK